MFKVTRNINFLDFAKDFRYVCFVNAGSKLACRVLTLPQHHDLMETRKIQFNENSVLAYDVLLPISVSFWALKEKMHVVAGWFFLGTLALSYHYLSVWIDIFASVVEMCCSYRTCVLYIIKPMLLTSLDIRISRKRTPVAPLPGSSTKCRRTCCFPDQTDISLHPFPSSPTSQVKIIVKKLLCAVAIPLFPLKK